MPDMVYPGPGHPVRIVGTDGAALDSGGALTIAQPAPTATSGSAATTVSRIVSAAADTNPVSAKDSAGHLYEVIGYNAAAATRYLKFYNKASAPTVGTDTPVLTLPLPASTAFHFHFSPLYFSTGIAYGMVTGSADNSTAALTAADVVGLNVVYR